MLLTLLVVVARGVVVVVVDSVFDSVVAMVVSTVGVGVVDTLSVDLFTSKSGLLSFFVVVAAVVVVGDGVVVVSFSVVDGSVSGKAVVGINIVVNVVVVVVVGCGAPAVTFISTLPAVLLLTVVRITGRVTAFVTAFVTGFVTALVAGGVVGTSVVSGLPNTKVDPLVVNGVGEDTCCVGCTISMLSRYFATLRPLVGCSGRLLPPDVLMCGATAV